MTKTGTIRVKVGVIRDAMHAAGLSAWKIHQATGLNLRTVQHVVAGKDSRESSVLAVLNFLELDYCDAVVGERRPVPSQNDGQPTGRRIHEWEVAEVLTDWQTAANGLQYKVCKMKHLHRDGTLARGKQYDLSIPATREKDRLRTLLNRHPHVCDQFRGHPHIAMHLRTTPAEGEDLWWVIDEWVEGPTLAAAMDPGPIAPARLPPLMRDIAMGLKALHDKQIILRELSAASILLRNPLGTAVLTDFELARLSDGSPTVAKNRWPRNPYRAPEVGVATIDVTVDLYSWGRILTHALSGGPLPPPRGKDREILTQAILPKPVLEVALACTNPVCTRRPRGMDEVIAAIRKWR